MYKINEDQEALEVTTRLDERMNLEQTNVDGKKMIIIHENYASQHLFGIERFVKDIVEGGWRGGFIDETTRYTKIQKVRQLYLGKKYYYRINDWLEWYSDMYRYSARVEAFYDACKSMGLTGDFPAFYFRSPEEVELGTGVRYMECFNALIEQVYARCNTREFKERERLRKVNSERNKQNVLALEETMFSEESGMSRWLILSLTLRYKPKYRRWITPAIIQQHRERFFAACHFNKLMAGIENQVWSIEQAEVAGLHLHVILFYSAESNHDEHIAKLICEYWVNVVTDGKGDYWNSNDPKLKKKYEERGHGLGVGQINWNDFAKREALRVNLVYLAKAEQYLMSKLTSGIHTFGMGLVRKKAKSGRPRSAPNRS
jgi:hypothetical protein